MIMVVVHAPISARGCVIAVEEAIAISVQFCPPDGLVSLLNPSDGLIAGGISHA
jgi:hypothetical protein